MKRRLLNSLRNNWNVLITGSLLQKPRMQLYKKIKCADEGKVNLDSINLLFYRKIAECTDYQEYMDNVCKKYHFVVNAEMKPLISDYAEEIFINSEITTKKYKIFRWAIRADYVALIALLILVLVA